MLDPICISLSRDYPPLVRLDPICMYLSQDYPPLVISWLTIIQTGTAVLTAMPIQDFEIQKAKVEVLEVPSPMG